jgi:hypothetical protein
MSNRFNRMWYWFVLISLLLMGGVPTHLDANSQFVGPSTTDITPQTILAPTSTSSGVLHVPTHIARAIGGAGKGAAIKPGPTGAALAATPDWYTTGDLHTARIGSTATLLPNGTVLVAGGGNGNSDSITSAEVYDPARGIWRVTGSMKAARSDHTATLLPNGTVLVVGGFRNDAPSLASAEVYDPATETWRLTGSMHDGRTQQTATLLSDGRVLVVGGISSGEIALASAELFNPTTGIWASTDSLQTPRYEHTATLLPDSTVLVAGGYNPSDGSLRNAELYNPKTGIWTLTDSLMTDRAEHTATLLPDGRVLVTGGMNGSSSNPLVRASSEIYDPTTGVWTSTGDLNTARVLQTATLLPNGTVLVAAGFNFVSGELTTTEIYDPATGTWTATGNLLTPRYGHTATLLPSGSLLVASGYHGVALASAEVYNPTSGGWHSTGGMGTGRHTATATLLPDGRVLVVGGYTDGGGSSLASVELYDPTSGTWQTTESLLVPRFGHTATLLPDGMVLVVGGMAGDNAASSPLASAELYDPSTGKWHATGSMSARRINHTATLLPDGTVLVTGGVSKICGDGDIGCGYLASAEIYDPAAGVWHSTESMSVGRDGHTATLLPNGTVLVAGTFSEPPLASAEIYDPATGAWHATGSMRIARSFATATLLPNGTVLIAGGYSRGELASAEVYDPTTGVWSLTGSMSVARSDHTATLLPNGAVLIAGGGQDGAIDLASAELYDAARGIWSLTSSLAITRDDPTATLLRDGSVLIAGGWTSSNSVSSASAEIYDTGLGFQEGWRPALDTITSPVPDGGALVAHGSGFTGHTEASSGNTASSATNFPLLQLRSLVNDQTRWLVPSPSVGWSDTSFTSQPVADFPRGYALATVFTNGIPSIAKVIQVGGPRWLVLLYLAGDDIAPTQTGQSSLSAPIQVLLSHLNRMSYNPAMRLVVLADGNQPSGGDAHLYVRQPNGFQDITEAALASPLWTGLFTGPSGQRELDTGNWVTLHTFVAWARATYPDSPQSMLTIVDHGGGWAPDFDLDGPPQPSGGRLQAGGWRGMSLDLIPKSGTTLTTTVSSGTSLSTRDTRLALAGVGHFDVIFFDACLMGMIESAAEIQPYTDYFIAGQNLLWSRLPYEHYLNKETLTPTTTARQLATRIVQNYNQPAYSDEPFTIAALEMAKLPRLITDTNTLAQGLLATLPSSPVPLTNAARLALTHAYRATQKFDYDSSFSIDATDGYLDLIDFATKLRLESTMPLSVTTSAQAVIADTTAAVIATNAVSGTTRWSRQPWNFAGAHGLSIYLPLGELDCRPTGLPITDVNQAAVAPCAAPTSPVRGQPIVESQLRYYANSEQLAFTAAAPQWAQLLQRLEANTPQKGAPAHSPFPPQSTWYGYLSTVRR